MERIDLTTLLATSGFTDTDTIEIRDAEGNLKNIASIVREGAEITALPGGVPQQDPKIIITLA